MKTPDDAAPRGFIAKPVTVFTKAGPPYFLNFTLRLAATEAGTKAE
jgi:hypothetical protein